MGKFIKSINKKILDSYISLLYNSKSKSHAKLLYQPYKNICWLNSYFLKIQVVKLAEYKYNTNRKIIYLFLFCCPLWDKAEPCIKQLANKHNRQRDILFILKGWSDFYKNKNFNKQKPDLAMILATINFVALTKRLDKKIILDEGKKKRNLVNEAKKSEKREKK